MLIEFRGRKFFIERAVQFNRGVEHAIDFVATHRGDKNEWRAGREKETFKKRFLVFVAVIAGVFVAGKLQVSLRKHVLHEVSFVDDDDDGLLFFDRFAGDGFVLLGHSFESV